MKPIEINPSPEITVHPITDGDACVVVDNFLSDPEGLVAFAAEHAAAFEPQQIGYPGVLYDVPRSAMDDIQRFIAGRKDTASALLDRAHPNRLEEGQQIPVEELAECRTQEFNRRAKVVEKVAQGGGVGQVAASLARDAQLATGAIHLFQQQDVRPVQGRLPRRQQARRAAPNHDNAFCHECLVSCKCG